MTLLELVVGLTIAGLAVSTGYAALAGIADHGARAVGVTDATTTAAAKRRLLLAWVRGARLDVDRAGADFRGLDGTRDGVPDDELAFLTTTATEVSDGSTLVRLFIDRDSLTPERGLTAEISRWPRQESRRIEIAEGVSGLDCRFLTRMLGEDEWLPSWISGTVLPLGVELRLIPAATDTLPRLLSLPLVAALEPAL